MPFVQPPRVRSAAKQSLKRKISNNDVTTSSPDLPISSWKEQILTSIAQHQVLILQGDTGSGKTTQIPQYLYQAQEKSMRSRVQSEKTSSSVMTRVMVNDPKNDHHHSSKKKSSKFKKIAVTQPRRVAAMSVAKRVSEEMHSQLGQIVGYKVRFDSCVTSQTRIHFLTDGMLVREAMLDPTLSQYAYVTLDEAHERSLQTDILFGIVKRALILRSQKLQPLKVIVMSATLDARLFQRFFSDFTTDCLCIPGRQYPTTVYYTPVPVKDYLDAAFVTLLQIVTSSSKHEHQHQHLSGDILVFLTGREDIDTLTALLEPVVTSHDLCVLPLFSALAPELQARVFDNDESKDKDGSSSCRRKIILATNIAETSITIPGIRIVVDCGLVKVKSMTTNDQDNSSSASSSGMETLSIEPISQPQAWQRSGRAGREGPGNCFRLYTEEIFENVLPRTSVPEIQRVNLEHVSLQLKSMGISNLLTFDFLEAPSRTRLVRAMEKLYALGALGDRGELTTLGRHMAQLPIGPSWSKALLASTGTTTTTATGKTATIPSCLDEMIGIVSMLSVESIFYFPKRHERETALVSRERFKSNEGDFLTLLQIYQSFPSRERLARQKDWCRTYYINWKSMTKVVQVAKQLKDHLVQMKLYHPSSSSSSSTDEPSSASRSKMSDEVQVISPELSISIRKALVAGLFLQSAMLVLDDNTNASSSSPLKCKNLNPTKRHYQPLFMPSSKKMLAQIHPSSFLFQSNPAPKYVLYNELVYTTRSYLRNLVVIEKEWLAEMAPKFFSLSARQRATVQKLDTREVLVP